MSSRRSPEALVNLLKAKPVVDLPTIRAELGGVSHMTAFRYLRRVPYRRSYNHNGRFYCFYDPARHDRFGLWSWQGVHFSVDGSLKRTVRRLVHEAVAGVTQRELQERLRVRVDNTLLGLLREEEITRERLAKVYVYLHADPSVRAAQRAERERQLSREAQSEPISEAVIIQVLLTLIRHPGLGPEEIVRRLRGHPPSVERAQVETIFARYALGEKGGS